MESVTSLLVGLLTCFSDKRSAGGGSHPANKKEGRRRRKEEEREQRVTGKRMKEGRE